MRQRAPTHMNSKCAPPVKEGNAKEAAKEEDYNYTGQEMKDRRRAGRNNSAFIEELASTKVETSTEINSTPVPRGGNPTA